MRVTDESNRTLEKVFIEVLDDPAEDLILADQDDRLIGYWRFDEEAEWLPVSIRKWISCTFTGSRGRGMGEKRNINGSKS